MVVTGSVVDSIADSVVDPIVNSVVAWVRQSLLKQSTEAVSEFLIVVVLYDAVVDPP